MHQADKRSALDKHIAKLSWEILEHKYWYYQMQRPQIEDWEFDLLAREYEDWCEIVGVEPTANMVGFDPDRPSCRLAMYKVHRVNPGITPNT